MTRPYKMVCVVAMARNRVIGDGQGLLWHLPGDLKRVKALTMGCPLIMGRRTFDSIGRALPGRLSLVMTRNRDWSADGAVCVRSFSEAIQTGISWLATEGGNEQRLILFGGADIYAQGLDYCEVIEATYIDAEPEEGVRFPQLSADDWSDSHLESHPAGPHSPAFHYHRLVRRNAPLRLR